MSPRLIGTLGMVVVGVVFVVSGDPGRAESLDEPPSLQSCPVGTSDLVEPLTAATLQTLMTRYVSMSAMCGRPLRSSLDDIFALEKRDERWAGPLERKISSAAVAVDVKLTGECHASLCRYDFKLTHPSQFGIDHQVISSVTDTDFAVESIHFPTPSGYRSYFYSTVLPAAFVEPLRRIMDTGNTLAHHDSSQ